MKKLLVYFIYSITLLAISSFLLAPPQIDYDKKWDQVEDYVDKGLPKSALKIVDEIYKSAKSEGENPQVLKALIYRVSLQSQFEEEHLLKAIGTFEEELESASSPEKQIIHSLLAELYHWYYQGNLWKINERGIVAGIDLDDISTWDAVKLNETIHHHYLASLQDSRTLQGIELEVFKPILKNTGDKSLGLYPTLDDLLAHRALRYFAAPDAGLADISSQVHLDLKEMMAPAEEFIELRPEGDSSSNEYLTIRLYQRLLKLHLTNKDTEAFVDLDLNRLSFLYNHSLRSEELTDAYIEALSAMVENYKDNQLMVRISGELAQQYVNRGSQYQPLTINQYRYDLNTAEEIIETALDSYPVSKDKTRGENLLKQIRDARFSLKANTAELPGQAFLAQVSLRNITGLYFRIVKMDPEEELFRDVKNDRNGVITSLLKETPVREWSQEFPDTKDHQPHTAEISIPALETGYYMFFASTDGAFKSREQIAYRSLWITSLSYIGKNNVDGSLDLHVLDRESGNHVEGVEIKAYEQEYSSREQESKMVLKGTFRTNQEGFVKVSILDKLKYGSLMLSFRKGNDVLHSSNKIGLYRSSTESKLKTKTYFFTDRAIYRPGQTVYFKGMAIDRKGNEVSVKAGHKTKVGFYNVNRKLVGELTLTANEYGSFQGSFVIPTGGLNGKMMIRDKDGSISFAVEEYKRPTFKVTFDTVPGEFRIGDKVRITGKAENYASNPLMRANVKYRVVRDAVIMPYYRFYYPMPENTKVEMTNGTVTTRDDGTFEIDFEALADNRMSGFPGAPYRFMVFADVTDITGEVQSGQSMVLVGKSTFYLTLESPPIVNLDESKGFTVKATNLSGSPIETAVDFELHKLIPPDRLLNSRRWNQADMEVIPKEEFIEKFPHDVFGDEDDKKNWKRELVSKQSMDISGKAIAFGELISSLAPGDYMVSAVATTKEGDTIKTDKLVTLYSPEGKKMPPGLISWSTLTKTKAEPGESIHLIIGSAAKKTMAFYEVLNGDEFIDGGWIMVSKGQKSIEIPVKEEYRGNFTVRTAMVRYNRSYINDYTIQVPFTNKKLDISLETFRDYLTPGQKEEWKVRITGPDGEILASELLAGMYDASLDSFKSNDWKLNLYKTKKSRSNLFTGHFWASGFRLLQRHPLDYQSVSPVLYPEIDWFGYQMGQRYFRGGRDMLKSATLNDAAEMSNESAMETVAEPDAPSPVKEMEEAPPPPPAKQPEVPLRTNFNETAFFYPQLTTDSLGNVILSFTTPDALTEWKMLMLATTKDLKTASMVKEFKAKKDLMVIPNVPRFVRQGDQLLFAAKVVNFTDEPLRGEAHIEFYDAITQAKVNLMGSENSNIALNIGPNGNQLVNWNLNIPYDLNMLVYRITAKAGDFTDGEERMLPVLTNRMLVTETLPMPLKGNQTRTFEFEKLLSSDKVMVASTRKNYRFTVEFTSNPAWYAIQALPYMSEPKTENSSNLFHRYYANALSGFIINSNPKIKGVVEAWKTHTPESFYSNLQKNEELKSVVLDATPWVLEAEDEAEQKRRIATLFDLGRLTNEKEGLIAKLSQNQLQDGAWPWFKGMRPDRHTTQTIVLGFAKLLDKDVLNIDKDPQIRNMIKRALAYLDGKIVEDYENIKKNHSKTMNKDHLGSLQIEYLYLRAMLSRTFQVSDEAEEAFGYFSGQAKKHWLKKSNYLQGMLALTLHRFGQRNEAEAIIRSLKERALKNEEMGMYWRVEWSWRWYQAPVETQSMMIEAFNTVTKDAKSVQQMKVWLLKQKQTNRWKTTSGTAEAVFALLLTGDDLLDEDGMVELTVGSKKISAESDPDMTTEAGTGYFKTAWTGEEITADMGQITATNPNNSISWGAAYWQYFEDLDKLTGHDSPLSLEKQLYVEELTTEGPVIRLLKEGEKLKLSDKVVVRLVIRSDRDMDYVHLKDMRCSGFEPTKTLSGYQWQGGLSYYLNTRDASTDFFIQRLQKGTYVLEYPLMVTQKGDFSNGIATIQSYYAPEFGAHSAGVRIAVVK